MADIEIGFAGIGLLLILLAFRVPIGFALFGVAVIGLSFANRNPES